MSSERIKRFKTEMKMFFWYLATEPFRAIKSLLFISKDKLKFFTKNEAWIIIYTGFVIIFMFVDNNKMKWAFIFLLLIAIFKYEWERKYFIQRYREKYKDKLARQYGQHTPSDEELVEDFEKNKEVGNGQLRK